MKETTKRWLEWLGLICLFLTIISLSITLTINFRPLYIFDVTHLKLADEVLLSKTVIVKNYDQLMQYLNTPWQQNLHFPDFIMSESGAFHFYEVKRLFLLCYGVLAVTVIPSSYYLFYLGKNQRFWRLIRPFQWGMFVPVFFAILMTMGFDQFFTAFHGIFFNNDAWLFDPVTDPIINVLPEAYFMHCFILFFCVLEGLFLLGIIKGRRELRKN